MDVDRVVEGDLLAGAGVAPSIDEDRASLRARARRAGARSEDLLDRAKDLREQLEAMRLEVDQLREAMASRASIEQAKGIVMCRYAIPADAAWNYLVRLSQQSNRKVRDLAHDIIASALAAQPHEDVPEPSEDDRT